MKESKRIEEERKRENRDEALNPPSEAMNTGLEREKAKKTSYRSGSETEEDQPEEEKSGETQPRTLTDRKISKEKEIRDEERKDRE